jgi:hypothetical protein
MRIITIDEYQIDCETRDWEQIHREIRDREIMRIITIDEYLIDRETRDWEQIHRKIRDREILMIITFSACVSFLKRKFQKMSSIRCIRLLLINDIFLTTVPLAEFLRRKRQEVKDMPSINASDT